ncbi:MAG: hypothetical protein QNK05_01225 [Myxococcota bacterium]|nr:hypothetical protein [Myxococcota bacterium]
MDATRAELGSSRWHGLKGLLLGRRRTIVVDSRYQRRVAGTAAGLMGLGCAAFVGALYAETANIRSALARDPNLVEAIEGGLGLPALTLALVAAALCASIYVFMLVETHRTAGAAVALERLVQALADGRYAARTELRKGDRLGQLKYALDQLGHSLQRRVESDAQAIDALAERLDDEKDGPIQASELRDLAQRLRERVRS